MAFAYANEWASKGGIIQYKQGKKMKTKVKIEIAININSEPEKDRGDLLEKLTMKILSIQGYQVETQIRITGTEVDLLCTNKNNPAQKIYVECKAYRDKKISADIIDRLMGVKMRKRYPQAYLITTSELNKDAKGIKLEIEQEECAREFTFFSQNELIQSLIDANIISIPDIIEQQLAKKIDKHNIGEIMLLVTKYDYFYLVEHKQGGSVSDVFAMYAEDGKIVEDNELLNKIKETDTSYSQYNFQANNLLKEHEENKSITTPTLSTSSFKLSEEYINQIENIKVNFTHPKKIKLCLSDIFVFQDLREIEEKPIKKQPISSEKLLDIQEYKKCLVFGEGISGKTSLLSMLQKKLNEKGWIPISIDAKDIKSSEIDAIKNKIQKAFEKQYSHIQKDVIKFHQSKIILMIDNFDSISIKRLDQKTKFLKHINEIFEYILIFSNDSAELEIMTKQEFKEALKDFRFFTIKQFGYALRDKMIEKWIYLDQQEELNDNELLEKKDDFLKKLNVAVGYKFIPTFPLYILTLLQQFEAGSKSGLGGSAYADFYHYLIVQSMENTNIKPDELDFYHTYLSYVAYFFFIKKTREISTEEAKKIHEAYSLEYHKQDFSDIYTNLLKAGLLKQDDENYSFAHKYIYYFYVAKYLSDNIEKSSKSQIVKEHIYSLIQRLYIEDFANIILFLIHHSKARTEGIIEQILDEARKIFKDIQPTTLSGNDLLKINELIQEEIHLVLEDKNPHEHRKTLLESRDHFDEINEEHNRKQEETIPAYDDEIEELDIFGKINLSVKLIEIIGQITKNYYGSLERRKKKTLLLEACDLGFRNLNNFIQNVTNYRDLIVSNIQEEIERKRTLSPHETREMAGKMIFAFTGLVCMFFVKKISSSISSKNLFEDIESICEDNKEDIAKQMIWITTKLNFCDGLQVNKIDEKNRELSSSNNLIAKELLRHIVIEHLYKFDVPINKKQQICDKLRISTQAQKNILIHKKGK